jgi:hypothetical protein
MMHLRNRGVYQFNDAAASIYRGLRFVVDRTLNGYALYTPEAWDVPRSDPCFVVDAHGRLRHQGAWTGYTVEELVPIGEARPDDVHVHGPVDQVTRRHRVGTLSAVGG